MRGAAQAAGVDVRTVRRWMKGSRLFGNAVRQAQLSAWREEATGKQSAA